MVYSCNSRLLEKWINDSSFYAHSYDSKLLREDGNLKEVFYPPNLCGNVTHNDIRENNTKTAILSRSSLHVFKNIKRKDRVLPTNSTIH